MVKETTALMVIIVVVVLVVGGVAYSLAPKILDAILDFLGTGIGGGNEAQLTWFIELPDGTTEDIDPNTFNVFYAGKEISYIGFRTQIKLSYINEVKSISYNAEMTVALDGVSKQTGSTGEQTMTNVGASGEWFDLVGATISFSAITIEGWTSTEGTHQLEGSVTLALTVYQADTNEFQSLSGTASGDATIEIVKNEVTLDVSMKTVAISVYPTTLR